MGEGVGGRELGEGTQGRRAGAGVDITEGARKGEVWGGYHRHGVGE